MPLPRPDDAVRHVQWLPRFGDPRVYLAGVIGVPVALALIIVQPLRLPEVIYALLVATSGFPVFLMVQDAAEARGHSAYNLWALRAQLWLQLGGALKQAVRATPPRPPVGRHTATPPEVRRHAVGNDTDSEA